MQEVPVPHPNIFVPAAPLPLEYRQFFIRGQNLAPRRRKGGGCGGEGLLTLGPGAAYLAMKQKRTGLAFLLALALSIGAGVLAGYVEYSRDPSLRSLAPVCWSAAFPGLLIWLVLLDLVMTHKRQFVIDPKAMHVLVDGNRQMLSLEVPTGRWVTFGLVKEWSFSYGDLVTELVQLYGERLTTEKLPRLTKGDWIAIGIFGVFLAAVAGLVLYSVYGR